MRGLGLVYPGVEEPTWSFAIFQEKMLLAFLCLKVREVRAVRSSKWMMDENHQRIYKHPHPLLPPKFSLLR